MLWIAKNDQWRNRQLCELIQTIYDESTRWTDKITYEQMCKQLQFRLNDCIYVEITREMHWYMQRRRRHGMH